MKVYPAQIRSGTEMIFSQNLFRRPTPARLTRIEKACYKRIFVQSTTANITS